MEYLKSLRASIGTYGRVRAGGIVRVDAPTAKSLLKSKLFVKATEADIEAAKESMADFVKNSVTGVPAGFAPMSDRLSDPSGDADAKAKADADADAKAKADADADAKAEKKAKGSGK